ncbi:MAG: GNAT family N-acetyltransferase [Anaerolinea sp.]|nr:GNAT family N-acetyltransferase [Anaerolinea sp.]
MKEMPTIVSHVIEAYTIRPFHPTDQSAAKALILAGLAERWGELDPTLNRDLDDIWAHYVAQGGAFIVVTCQEKLVGTGALRLEAPDAGRIERVSVHKEHRRHGLARAISEHLIAEARRCGCQRVLVETTATWESAIRLYAACGFVPYEQRDGDVHMVLQLNAGSGATLTCH